MTRRTVWSMIAALLALCALATPAVAGGWVVITLDTLPTEMRASQPISLGFMVRQHGTRPTHDVEPRLTATNTTSGEEIEFLARREGELGHYVVDVTFPNTGTWNIEIIPTPFGSHQIGTFTVLAAASATPDSASRWALQPVTLRWLGGMLVLSAVGLALLNGRERGAKRSPVLTTK